MLQGSERWMTSAPCCADRPPGSIYFVSFSRWDDHEGGAYQPRKVTTTPELRELLRAAQVDVDDIDQAVTAFEEHSAGAFWIPRIILTSSQIGALGI
jgi:hypothetical protein